MSLVLGWGAYAWDKVPQQDFALKRQGGLCTRGGVFVGHYGICMKSACPSMNDLGNLGSGFSEKLKVVRSPLKIF